MPDQPRAGTVAGIDFDTRHIHVAVLAEDNDACFHRLELACDPDLQPLYRARHVRRVMPGSAWWEDQGVYLAAIERPMGPHRNAIAALMRIQGAIITALPAALTVIELAPQEWKHELGLAGNAGKDAVARRVLELAGPQYADTAPWCRYYDATDAYGIAYAARELNQRGWEKHRERQAQVEP